MKTKSNKIFHFIPITHWDREWYRTFEEFRKILVNLIDELIEILDTNPEYKNFHLDGQTAVLEDYLEIHPEKAEKISELIRQQKIFVGPWYVLPDEFLVSGEALIRNLQRGHKIGEHFGKVMKVGYIPDSFGHISQLPQIFKGFGIDNVILWRGLGGERGQESSEYKWRSPDGTETLMIHLLPGGYGTYFIHTTNTEEIVEKGQEIYNQLLKRTSTNQLLWMSGSDHLWPYEKLPAVLKTLNEHFPDSFIHSKLEEYIKAVKSCNISFPKIEGEHRSGYRYSFLLQGVYSSRMYLKQMNEACQTSLERYAEPLNAIAKLYGQPSQLPFLNLAWKYLLQNHPHDSICGCSIDAVHREMVIRFEKCLQISNQITSHALSQLVSDVDDVEENISLYIYNPCPYKRSELVECTVDFPDDQSLETMAQQNFIIKDLNNSEIPFQILNCKKDYQLIYSKHDYLKQKLVSRYLILIDAENLPAMGVKQFNVIQNASSGAIKKSQIEIGRFYLENRSTRVEISDCGVVKVFDKVNGYTYNKLNIFEDSTDVGDEYNYSYPENDELYLSNQFKPRLSVVESGPLRGAIRIRTRMKLPPQASEDKKSRSNQNAVLKLSSVVYLEYNSPVVYFITTALNNIKDHRLRVLFQTDIGTNESYAETAFHVIKRKHRKYEASDYELEVPSSTHPMQRFVTIADKKKGFTLFTKGLPEYELKPYGQGTLALTLLRCVGKLSGSDLITRPGGNAGPNIETPEAQCQGVYTFKYAILPHKPDFQNEVEKIYDFSEWHNYKPAFIQKQGTSKHNTQNSILTIEPKSLRLSAFKETEDGEGFLVRVYNPSDQKITAFIRLNFILNKVYLTNLNEIILDELKIYDGNKIRLPVKPWEIVSIKLYIL